ncbi:uncharacterized protein LOC128722948 [Anopheles nili]|uniref:uncharacterized protein LOC128722948 n=1 Tax=Anopheles nili TaxID=185578 RepID=UPI00237A3759|nr:uncharacterized protein LOC128722948 [Anopheles nili]
MENASPSERQKGGQAILEQRRATSALDWLLIYSLAMFTLPFGAFYFTRHALTDYLHIEGFPNTCGSVVAAVLVVNVIILLYALRGYEDAKEDDENAPDETASEANMVEPKKVK